MISAETLKSVTPILGDYWYILRVRPNYEHVAKEFLEKQVRGSEIYYPCGTVLKGVDTPRVAVFKGYVYSRFHEQWPEWARLDTYCSAQPRLLLRFIHEDEESRPVFAPLRIRHREVQAIMTDEAAGKWDEVEPKNPLIELLLGRQVQIPCGTCKGKSGKVISIVGDVVTISVKMLGSKAKISMNLREFSVFY